MTDQKTINSRYYVMNMLSNLNSNFAPKNKEELQLNINRIKDCLKEKEVSRFLGGDWRVVWGPCLCSSPVDILGEIRHVTDNAMYIAKQEGESAYFIGISGTNGQSRVGWFDEDFDVDTMVNWPYPIAEEGQAKISNGANQGLQKLLGMQDPVSQEDPIRFLKRELKDKDATLTVGGHSLGGCLTPVLAAKIAHEMKGAKGLSIQAYPTAGPTPGNKAFVDHLTKVLTRYHAVYNENDLVAQAWDFEGLDSLLNNYDGWKFGKKRINPNEPLIKKWMQWAKQSVSDLAYERSPSEGTDCFKIESWVNPPVPKIITKEGDRTKAAIYFFAKKILNSSRVKNQMNRICPKTNFWRLQEFSRFFLQVGLQHVTAYNKAATGDEARPPIILDDKINTKLQEYFGKQSSATLKWKCELSIQLFEELAEKVADWFEAHPVATTALSIKEDMGDQKWTEELSAEDLQNMENLDQIFELESEEAQEEALEALGVDLSFMPWNQNPFSF